MGFIDLFRVIYSSIWSSITQALMFEEDDRLKRFMSSCSFAFMPSSLMMI